MARLDRLCGSEQVAQYLPPLDVNYEELVNNIKILSEEYGFFERARRALIAAVEAIPDFTDVLEQAPRITNDTGMVPEE
jgi:hypothetical protein